MERICKKCKHKFEDRAPFSGNIMLECPKCGEELPKRGFSAPPSEIADDWDEEENNPSDYPENTSKSPIDWCQELPDENDENF